MTWNVIAESWVIRSFHLYTVNTGDASNHSKLLRSIMENMFCVIAVLGSHRIQVSIATSDYEASTARTVDLHADYVRSVRCVVHIIALALNDVFEEGTARKKFWHMWIRLRHVSTTTPEPYSFCIRNNWRKEYQMIEYRNLSITYRSDGTQALVKC